MSGRFRKTRDTRTSCSRWWTRPCPRRLCHRPGPSSGDDPSGTRRLCTPRRLEWVKCNVTVGGPGRPLTHSKSSLRVYSVTSLGLPLQRRLSLLSPHPPLCPSPTSLHPPDLLSPRPSFRVLGPHSLCRRPIPAQHTTPPLLGSFEDLVSHKPPTSSPAPGGPKSFGVFPPGTQTLVRRP